MKAINALITLALLAFISSKIDNNSNIYKAVQDLVPRIPELKKEVLDNPIIKTGELQLITNRGFASFKQKTEILNYNEVEIDDLDGFLTFLGDIIELPSKFLEKFNKALGLIEFSDFKEFIAGNFIFSVGKGGECKYVCVFSQRNENGTTDWLIGNVSTTFSLAPDLMIYEQSSRAIFGFKKSKIVVHEIPRVLTNAQLETLSSFFQVSVIERFGISLGIIKN